MKTEKTYGGSSIPEIISTESKKKDQTMHQRTDTHGVKLHDFAELAIRMCPKNEKQPKTIHIHADGSYYDTKPEDTSWSIVIIKQTVDGFSFLGYLTGKAKGSTRTKQEGSANHNTGELTALLWAYVAAYANYREYEVHMHADCEAARAAADGTLAIAADYELSRLTALAAEEVGRRMKVTSHYVK
ncbi:unnamed protein product, partial [Prorocentrum cordatum]